ncbi:hypothetical protein SLEP1_g5824 [Rubroshorea leprosula]|uniref:Uncharacterized protein n=1 Tax=Rubroshorea leprosula TaxID=152421 RepID=A0AAV5I295_9ROSI|nr:hypothetical protein SLEP1_g5824 [Rubroshorea leprosula]
MASDFENWAGTVDFLYNMLSFLEEDEQDSKMKTSDLRAEVDAHVQLMYINYLDELEKLFYKDQFYQPLPLANFLQSLNRK